MNAAIREMIRLARERKDSPYQWYDAMTECYAIAKVDRPFVSAASPQNVLALAAENVWLRRILLKRSIKADVV